MATSNSIFSNKIVQKSVFFRGLDAGKGRLCPKFWARIWLLSGWKGWKHRSPHELRGKICYCSWPPRCCFAAPSGRSLRSSAEIPQNNREKRASESKKPISHHPSKGSSESKNRHFYTEHYKENGALLTWSTLFLGWWEMGVFWLRNPLFPTWEFRVRGRRIPNPNPQKLSVYFGQKRRNALTTGRWGKQRFKVQV